MYVNRRCIFRRQKCDQERSRKVPNFKDLTNEIKRIWNVKTKETGTTGAISKLFRKYLRNLSGKQEIKEIQKAAI